MTDPSVYTDRGRICDLGYLRTPYAKVREKPDGSDEFFIQYRCPSEPVEDFVDKGGRAEDTKNRQCLCNNLAATIGMPQVQTHIEIDCAGERTRKYSEEKEIITAGDNIADDIVSMHAFIGSIAGGPVVEYTASDAIDYLRSNN